MMRRFTGNTCELLPGFGPLGTKTIEAYGPDPSRFLAENRGSLDTTDIYKWLHEGDGWLKLRHFEDERATRGSRRRLRVDLHCIVWQLVDSRTGIQVAANWTTTASPSTRSGIAQTHGSARVRLKKQRPSPAHECQSKVLSVVTSESNGGGRTMKGLLGLLMVGSVVAIGTVLFGGVGDTYELGDVAVLSGGMVLLAGGAVLVGSLAAQASWFEVEVPTESGLVTKRAYRPGLIVVALILFVVAGFIVFGSDPGASVTELGVGACFDEPTTLEVASVETVPCSGLHDYEVFGRVFLTGVDTAFPGRASVDEQAFFRCVPLFEDYVGLEYEVSILDVATLSPTAESWEDGDRGVTCALLRIDGDPLSGSVMGQGL